MADFGDSDSETYRKMITSERKDDTSSEESAGGARRWTIEQPMNRDLVSHIASQLPGYKKPSLCSSVSEPSVSRSSASASSSMGRSRERTNKSTKPKFAPKGKASHHAPKKGASVPKAKSAAKSADAIRSQAASKQKAKAKAKASKKASSSVIKTQPMVGKGGKSHNDDDAIVPKKAPQPSVSVPKKQAKAAIAPAKKEAKDTKDTRKDELNIATILAQCQSELSASFTPADAGCVAAKTRNSSMFLSIVACLGELETKGNNGPWVKANDPKSTWSVGCSSFEELLDCIEEHRTMMGRHKNSELGRCADDLRKKTVDFIGKHRKNFEDAEDILRELNQSGEPPYACLLALASLLKIEIQLISEEGGVASIKPGDLLGIQDKKKKKASYPVITLARNETNTYVALLHRRHILVPSPALKSSPGSSHSASAHSTHTPVPPSSPHSPHSPVSSDAKKEPNDNNDDNSSPLDDKFPPPPTRPSLATRTSVGGSSVHPTPEEKKIPDSSRDWCDLAPSDVSGKSTTTTKGTRRKGKEKGADHDDDERPGYKKKPKKKEKMEMEEKKKKEKKKEKSPMGVTDTITPEDSASNFVEEDFGGNTPPPVEEEHLHKTAEEKREERSPLRPSSDLSPLPCRALRMSTTPPNRKPSNEKERKEKQRKILPTTTTATTTPTNKERDMIESENITSGAAASSSSSPKRGGEKTDKDKDRRKSISVLEQGEEKKEERSIAANAECPPRNDDDDELGNDEDDDENHADHANDDALNEDAYSESSSYHIIKVKSEYTSSEEEMYDDDVPLEDTANNKDDNKDDNKDINKDDSTNNNDNNDNDDDKNKDTRSRSRSVQGQQKPDAEKADAEADNTDNNTDNNNRRSPLSYGEKKRVRRSGQSKEGEKMEKNIHAQKRENDGEDNENNGREAAGKEDESKEVERNEDNENNGRDVKSAGCGAEKRKKGGNEGGLDDVRQDGGAIDDDNGEGDDDVDLNAAAASPSSASRRASHNSHGSSKQQKRRRTRSDTDKSVARDARKKSRASDNHHHVSGHSSHIHHESGEENDDQLVVETIDPKTWRFEPGDSYESDESHDDTLMLCSDGIPAEGRMKRGESMKELNARTQLNPMNTARSPAERGRGASGVRRKPTTPHIDSADYAQEHFKTPNLGPGVSRLLRRTSPEAYYLRICITPGHEYFYDQVDRAQVIFYEGKCVISCPPHPRERTIEEVGLSLVIPRGEVDRMMFRAITRTEIMIFIREEKETP